MRTPSVRGTVSALCIAPKALAEAQCPTASARCSVEGVSVEGTASARFTARKSRAAVQKQISTKPGLVQNMVKVALRAKSKQRGSERVAGPQPKAPRRYIAAST